MSELRTSLKLTADASGLIAEVRKTEGSLEGLARTSLDTGESLKRSLGAAETSFRNGMREAGAANDNLTGKTKLTREQIMALQYTASDVAASLASGASPFTILLQQGGQVLQAFPGIAGRVLALGATAAAVAAPIAIIGTRIATAAGETRQLAGTIKALGNEAGVSADQLRRIAIEATKVGGSRTELYEAALSLVRNPAIQGEDMFKGILNLAPDVAAALGTSIPDAAQRMGEAFRAGADGVRKLDDDLNFLKPTELVQLQVLQDTAGKAGVARLAMGALQERVSGTAKAMQSDWSNAMHDAVSAWDEYIDHLANSDLARVVANQISGGAKAVRSAMSEARGDDQPALLRKQIEQVDRDYASLPEKTGGVSASHESLILRRIKLVQELNKLTDEASKSDGTASVQRTQSAERSNVITKELVENLSKAAACEDFTNCGSAYFAATIFNEAIK